MKHFSRYCVAVVLALMCANVAAAQSHFSERDTIDVLHYNINLDMGHKVPSYMQGWCEVTLRLLKPASQVSLGLMSATVDSVLVDRQGMEAVAFVYDQRQLRIPLDNAQEGDTLKLRVVYGSSGYVGTDGGMWCEDNLFYNLGQDRHEKPFSMGRSWFPCSDSLYDRATYDISLTVPAGWTGVASGLLTRKVVNEDSSRTFSYHLSRPVSTYHVGVNAAKYKLYYDTLGSWAQSQLPVQVAYLSVDSARVAADFSSLARTFGNYERWFGPYRWNEIRFSEGGPGAGMEHVNNICFEYMNNDMKYLIDHELAHQWFGNLITCDREADLWFNEGGASYADQLAAMDGAATSSDMKNNKRMVLTSIPVSEHGYHPLCGMPSQYSFFNNTYFKGALVFHELSNLLGERHFWSMLKNLFDQHAFTNMDSWQLRDEMSALSDVDLTDFFDFNIFNGGFASYGIDSLRTAGRSAHVWLRQRLWHAAEYNKQANVPVTFFSAVGDSATRFVSVGGEYADGQFDLPFVAEYAVVDYFDRSASANVSKRVRMNGDSRNMLRVVHFAITPTGETTDADMCVNLQFGYDNDPLLPGIVRWDYRRWFVQGVYSDDFEADMEFLFGSSNIVNDHEFYHGSATLDSLRLFYRKDAGSPWTMVKDATPGQAQTGLFMKVSGSPLRGEYMLAVVDTALLAVPTAEGAISSEPRLSLAPNPCDGYVTVSLLCDVPSQCRVAVYNAAGRLVYSAVPASQKVQIATRDLPSGVYYVMLTTPEGSTTRKLIVQ